MSVDGPVKVELAVVVQSTWNFQYARVVAVVPSDTNSAGAPDGDAGHVKRYQQAFFNGGGDTFKIGVVSLWLSEQQRSIAIEYFAAGAEVAGYAAANVAAPGACNRGPVEAGAIALIDENA